MKSLDRKGLYVHFLPEFAHARRTIWDGFTNEGERLIDISFPQGDSQVASTSRKCASS